MKQTQQSPSREAVELRLVGSPAAVEVARELLLAARLAPDVTIALGTPRSGRTANALCYGTLILDVPADEPLAAEDGLFVNSHADKPQCRQCGKHHTPINGQGYCLPCWLQEHPL